MVVTDVWVELDEEIELGFGLVLGDGMVPGAGLGEEGEVVVTFYRLL